MFSADYFFPSMLIVKWDLSPVFFFPHESLKYTISDKSYKIVLLYNNNSLYLPEPGENEI